MRWLVADRGPFAGPGRGEGRDGRDSLLVVKSWEAYRGGYDRKDSWAETHTTYFLGLSVLFRRVTGQIQPRGSKRKKTKAREHKQTQKTKQREKKHTLLKHEKTKHVFNSRSKCKICKIQFTINK